MLAEDPGAVDFSHPHGSSQLCNSSFRRSVVLCVTLCWPLWVPGMQEKESGLWINKGNKAINSRYIFPLFTVTSVIKHNLSWGEGFRLCIKEIPWLQHLGKMGKKQMSGQEDVKLRLTLKDTLINLTGVGLSTAEGPLGVDPGWSEDLTFPQCPLRGPGTAQDGIRYGLDGFLDQTLAQVARRGPW